MTAPQVRRGSRRIPGRDESLPYKYWESANYADQTDPRCHGRRYGSRYGGLKQIDPVGPSGEAILDYSLYDARRAGFKTVVFIIKHEIEQAFKEAVGARAVRAGFEVRYAYQQLEKLPEGFTVPEGRVKPWGTAHAILVAEEAIGDAPFAVINADDYYGPQGFKLIYDYLSTHADGDRYAWAMVGFLLGNTVSESVSCGIMLAFAARTPEFAPRPVATLHPYTRKELYDILWPVEGSRLLASALQAAESSLIPYTLAIYTGSRAEAVAQYGSLKGMALPLLFFPFSVLGALSGLLMPEITRAHTKGDTAAMHRLIFTMLRMTGAFSLAAGAGFVLLGAPLAGFIYRDAKVGRYVQLLGFVAPFMYLESMVDGVLKGLGEQLATFRYSLFDSVFRIAAIWLVVPQYGMMGFLGVMAVSNLMTCGLNMRRMMETNKKAVPPRGKVAEAPSEVG